MSQYMAFTEIIYYNEWIFGCFCCLMQGRLSGADYDFAEVWDQNEMIVKVISVHW